MERMHKNQTYIVLVQTSKSIRERIRIEMMNNNLNIAEFSVIEALYFKEKQIGNSILISSGSMTYVIDKLEQKGLLARNACPDDRRSTHVVLTDAGMDLMNKVMPRHQELIDDMFGSLMDFEFLPKRARKPKVK